MRWSTPVPGIVFTVCTVFLFMPAPAFAQTRCDSFVDVPGYGLRVGVCQFEARPGLPAGTEDVLLLVRNRESADNLENAARMRLSRIFAGGSRSMLVTVIDLEIMSPLGDGRPVVSVRVVADSYLGTEWSGAQTVETYWLTVDDGRLSPLTWFVESTEIGRVTIEYTHLFEHDDAGRLSVARQYAVQRVDGVPRGVDRTTRRFNGRNVTWRTGETRLQEVEPTASRVLVRRDPGHSARVFDALSDTPDPLDGSIPRSRVKSIAWHESELFYEVYLGRGETGWIPAAAVRWVP